MAGKTNIFHNTGGNNNYFVEKIKNDSNNYTSKEVKNNNIYSFKIIYNIQ